jgi:hypothetical protein
VPKFAPDGYLFVCLACGKTSPDLYGSSEQTMPGWDVSCALNAQLAAEKTLLRDPTTGRVIQIMEGGVDWKAVK